MNNIVKTAAASALIAATTLVAIAPASAHDHRRYRDNTGAIVAAGALGLAAGALIGNANRQGDVVYRYGDDAYYDRYDEPRYARPLPAYERPVRVYEQPRPVYVERYSSFEPWTRDWYRYCSDRYRSFDAQSGTFMGYDGVRHFCVAN
ncbi:BA14K family protein [Aliihoeflea sp. PC F10.4]